MAKKVTKPKPRKKGARTPDVFWFDGPNGEKLSLTQQEKNFCSYYLESMGADRIKCLLKAGYLPKGEVSASAMASEILHKPGPRAYIHSKLEEYGYTEENVDQQTLYLINQFGDLTNKLGGIKEYNKVAGRHAAQKIKIEDEYDDYTDDELETALEAKLVKRRKRDTGKNKKGAPKKAEK